MRALSLMVLLALASVAAACGGGGGGGGGEAKPSGVFYEMLKVVPDTTETRSWVVINDYARIGEQFDIPRPGPEAGEEELVNYILQVAAPGGDLTRPPRPIADTAFIGTASPYFELVLPDRKRYLGFGFQEVDQEVVAGAPPESYEAIRGSFDPSATEQAISRCAECPPATRLTHEGVTIYSWGDDFEPDLQRRFSPPAYDHLGRGGRIAVQERYVFRTIWTDGVRQMLDASQGKRTSLADIREFALMASAMSEMGVYSVLMSDQVQSEGVVSEDEPALGPYRTLAIGAGEDGKGPFAAIVLVYDEPSQAEVDVPVLRRRIQETSLLTGQPWSERVENMEVSAVGRTLRAKLRGDIALHPYNFFFMRDPLLLQR